MSVNFATPIAHVKEQPPPTPPPDPYAAFKMVEGRKFRQPLLTAPDAGNFSRGIELFLSSAPTVPDIYAWLDGTLTWVAATAAEPGHRLVLTTDPMVLVPLQPGWSVRTLGDIAMLELRPNRVIYENVDQVSVRDAIKSILKLAYDGASLPNTDPKSWHPTMRTEVEIVPGKQSVDLKEYLEEDRPPGKTIEETIEQLADGFVGAGGGALLEEVRVRAGERLGQAAPYLATDPLPSEPHPPFLFGPTDPNRARRLTFVTEDVAGQVLDPIYYLHVLIRQRLLPEGNRIVKVLTDVVAPDRSLRHPLVTLFQELGDPTVPTARRQVNGVYAYPLGELAQPHGYPRPPDQPVSLAEWQYTPATGYFNAWIRATGDWIKTEPTDPQKNKVCKFWEAHGSAANAICARLQIPCELLVALACTESLKDLSERSIRIEPLREPPFAKQNDREALRKSPAASAELDYDKLVGSEATVTAAYAGGKALDQTTLSVTFPPEREVGADALAKRRLLAGEADRLVITANSKKPKKTTTECEITVLDTLFDGGSGKGDTQEGGVTHFYSISKRGAASDDEGLARTPIIRSGRLWRLRIALEDNTLAGLTTATIIHKSRDAVSATPTSMVVTLDAGARTEADYENTLDLAPGDTVSLRVSTADATGQIRGLNCRVQFAPADSGTVYVLEGYSPEKGVPPVRPGDTWERDKPVRDSGLTWNQLKYILDVCLDESLKPKDKVDTVSPGIVQTLIGTAIWVRNNLDRLDPGIYDALKITPPPANPSEYLDDWLLTAKNSLLLGAAYVRQLYHKEDTRFDLPLVGAGYNRGRVKPMANTRWGLGPTSWDYPEHVAPYFNAAVDYFNEGPVPPAPVPAIRFMS